MLNSKDNAIVLGKRFFVWWKINVNVNSSGNDSTTQKQHQPKQMQIPLSVYDSSLVSPHYGINDRQPTNPLVDAATDFMTPFLQAMIKNQFKLNNQQHNNHYQQTTNNNYSTNTRTKRNSNNN